MTTATEADLRDITDLVKSVQDLTASVNELSCLVDDHATAIEAVHANTMRNAERLDACESHLIDLAEFTQRARASMRHQRVLENRDL